MIFPVRTDRPLRHTPWMNYTLIGLNVLVFLIGVATREGGRVPWAGPYVLNPADPQWYQFFTYQFLHGGWEHILFNMLFLYVFGNNLEDRFGPLGYLCFFLAGGVIAGLGHTAIEMNPVLGASGAVSAVTGAYLALFPKTNVTLVWFLLLITAFEIPSMYLILFSFAQDLLFQFLDIGRVAYLAHLSGNVFGFVVGMGLLLTRVLPREPYDFLGMVSRWNRRRQFRSTTRGGESPWAGRASRAIGEASIDPAQRRLMESRAAVSGALEAHQPERALDAYEALLKIDREQVMHRQAQLDLANSAMNAGRYHTAARAYELFLSGFPKDEFGDQVHLILGLIYLRYLGEPDRARGNLRTAAEKLQDPARRQMAVDMLAEMGEGVEGR